jgi:hypothetical protein
MDVLPITDLAAARSKIEATRAALQAALDGQEPPEEVRRVIERLEAEVARLEGVVVGKANERRTFDAI